MTSLFNNVSRESIPVYLELENSTDKIDFSYSKFETS